MHLSEPLPDENEIRAGYAQMWRQGALDLAGGVVDADPIPDDGSKRWGLSIIARVPPECAALFTGVTDILRPWTGTDHTFYDATTLHTTVRSCEFYRSPIAEDDAALLDYGRALNEVAAQIPPFSVLYRGLAANRTGIILQGFPQSKHLQHLRRLLHGRLRQPEPTGGPEAEQVRRGAHVSLAVFAGPLSDPQALVDHIERHRNHTYGTVTFTRLEVVRYHRTLRQVAVVPYTQAPLGVSGRGETQR